jgi:hypothetical protein
VTGSGSGPTIFAFAARWHRLGTPDIRASASAHRRGQGEVEAALSAAGVPSQDMRWLSRLRILPVIMFAAALLPGATIEGIVTDASGRPLENARIDHVGKMVVVVATDLAIKPSPDEIRTDDEGHFRVTTSTSAFVVRNPGYESERIRVRGDAQLSIVLRPITSTSRCKLSRPPAFKTKAAKDVDYTATWYYIETKGGRQGIISGAGSTYSLGAPSDSSVQTSVEYSEFMHETGVIDASGHSADGKYWRSKSIFGSAAQYFNQTRENAEQLDCVMDRVSLNLR